jgi:hypothetical protein
MVTATGCLSSRRPPLFGASGPIEVRYQDEAARSGLAVISVAPWEDYVAALQPAFALTSEQALAQALPTTSRQSADLLDAFALGLRLAPPSSARSRTSTTNTTDGATTTTSTSESTRRPGDLGSVNLPDAPSGGTPRQLTDNPLDAPLDGAAGALRYAAATALFQEVQLLNSYVRDAALARNKDVYVVRLQVSVLPQLRGQAYDAYTTLSFLLDTPTVPNPYSQTRSSTPTNQTVAVLPILVTDSLEQSFAEVSASRTREFVLGLTALISGFGASTDVGKTVQQLQSAVGTDFNALQTVTKVSANSLRVRFGAQHQIGAGLAMVPRNHTVTAVVLVNHDGGGPRTINVAAKTQVVRATDGRALEQRPIEDARRSLNAIVAGYLQQPTPATGLSTEQANLASQLAYAAALNRREEFNSAAQTLGINADTLGRLWLDVVENESRNAYAFTSFELPVMAEDTPQVATQTVTIFDDGKTAAVRVRGIGRLDPRLMSGYVNVGNAPAAVVPGSVAAAGPGAIQVTVPSLKKLGLCTANDCTVALELFRTRAPNRWVPNGMSLQQERVSSNLSATYRLIEPRKPEPPKVLFAMTTGAQEILRTQDGAGSLQLLFQRDDSAEGAKEAIYFVVKGADVVSALPAGLVSFGEHGWEVKAPKGANAALTLKLANLVDGVDVTITPRNGDPDAEASPLTLRVRTAPRARRE